MILDEETIKVLGFLKNYYDELLSDLKKAAEESDRAYGGYVRAFKGELVEYMARELVKIAWVKVLKQDKS